MPKRRNPKDCGTAHGSRSVAEFSRRPNQLPKDRRAFRNALGLVRSVCDAEFRFALSVGLSGKAVNELVFLGGHSVADLRARAIESAGDRADQACRLLFRGQPLQDDEQPLYLACTSEGLGGIASGSAEAGPFAIMYVRLQEVWGAVAIVGGGADVWCLSRSEIRWRIPTPPAAPADAPGPRGAYSVGTTSVSFSPDAKLLLVTFGNGTASVWDVGGETLLARLEGHSGGLNSAAFSSDGLHVATASHDRTARMWSEGATGWSCDRVFLGHEKAVWSVVFSPAGGILATAARDVSARLWCTATGDCLRTLLGHAAPLWCVAFSADGQRLATSSSDNTVRVWDSTTGDCVRTLEGHRDTVTRVSFTLGDVELLSSSRDGSVRFWLLEPELLRDDPSPWQELRIDSVDRIWATVMSPDGLTLFSVSGHGAYMVQKSDDDKWGAWRMIDGQPGLACALAVR